MSIFKNKFEHDYDAFMNVFFSDANGKLKNDTMLQKINDFRVLGISYLQNSEVVVDFLLDQDPSHVDVSVMILPVLFNIWHGLELLLKCGNMICDEYLGLQNQKYSKHTIDVYADQFLNKAKQLGLKNLKKEECAGLMEFIDECKANNAHFDFARYTFQSNGQAQFYNTPNDAGTVPVVGVDVLELARVLIDINYRFVNVIDFLHDMICRHGKCEKHIINESALKAYIENESCVRFVGTIGEPTLEDRVVKIKNSSEFQFGNAKEKV